MLVLSRREGERLVIDSEDIIITVLEIKGNQVRLGVTAPSDIKVYREEVWEQIHGPLPTVKSA